LASSSSILKVIFYNKKKAEISVKIVGVLMLNIIVYDIIPKFKNVRNVRRFKS